VWCKTDGTSKASVRRAWWGRQVKKEREGPKCAKQPDMPEKETVVHKREKGKESRATTIACSLGKKKGEAKENIRHGRRFDRTKSDQEKEVESEGGRGDLQKKEGKREAGSTG